MGHDGLAAGATSYGGGGVTGEVIRVFADKNFGFIRCDEGGSEYFFHKSALLTGSFEGLRLGDRVSFEAGDFSRGLRAEAVELL